MRVAVVGGGIVGLFAAHNLEKHGARVTVIDRGQVGGACSAGNAGWICPSICFPLPSPGLTLRSLRWLLRSGSPLYIRPSAIPRLAPWLSSFRRFCTQPAFTHGAAALSELAAETLTLFEELDREGVSFEHRRDGLLMVFRDGRALDEELELLRLTGYEDKTRVLSADELAASQPALAPGLAGGILAEPEWHVRPESLCRGLARSLGERGVELIEQTEVHSFDCEGNGATALRTGAGPIDADAFVLATGAEAGRLSALIGCPLPVEAGKGYSITVDRPAVELSVPLYLTEARVAITPFTGSLRISGTMELSGINLDLDTKRIAALERAALREVPAVLDGERSDVWVGMRPITPDGLPFIGRLPTRDNVYVATGHQMLGMTLAPTTGRALAEMMLDGKPGPALSSFAPGRFR